MVGRGAGGSLLFNTPEWTVNGGFVGFCSVSCTGGIGGVGCDFRCSWSVWMLECGSCVVNCGSGSRRSIGMLECGSCVMSCGSRSCRRVWMVDDRPKGNASGRGLRCCWSKGLSGQCSSFEFAMTVCRELAGFKRVSSATLALLFRRDLVMGLAGW